MAGAHHVLTHLRERGRLARVAVGAPTIADARDVCAEGVTGLIKTAPDEFSYNRSLGEAWHKDGGYVKFLGSEEPDRWNGPQWSLLWADELALWKEESWHQAQFGLRLGEHPRSIVTTTPKARRFVKVLSERETTSVTTATTYDNPLLSQNVLARLEEIYGGTTVGRQELYAEWVDEVEGAYWKRATIEQGRILNGSMASLVRIVVAIDPAGTHNAKSDETGIVVAGKADNGEYYVLHGKGYKLSPQGWASRAIDLYNEFQADRIVAERNNGGEMVEYTLRSISPDIPLKTIHASRGKAVRAEPVAALYEQGKVHHHGRLTELEDQMCLFPIAAERDDMVDALVYAITSLMGSSSTRMIIGARKQSIWS